MKKKIAIEGMECEYCASEVLGGLLKVKGVGSVNLNYAEKNAMVELTYEVSNDQLIKVVEEADCRVVDIKDYT